MGLSNHEPIYILRSFVICWCKALCHRKKKVTSADPEHSHVISSPQLVTKPHLSVTTVTLLKGTNQQVTSLSWNALLPFPSSSVFPIPFELYLVPLDGVSGARALFLSLLLWHASLMRYEHHVNRLGFQKLKY